MQAFATQIADSPVWIIRIGPEARRMYDPWELAVVATVRAGGDLHIQGLRAVGLGRAQYRAALTAARRDIPGWRVWVYERTREDGRIVSIRRVRNDGTWDRNWSAINED